jgi:hypothetical protein
MAYEWHRDSLSIPSYLGAMLVGLSLGSWWLGIVLSIFVMLLMQPLHRAYFSESRNYQRRKDLSTNALFVVVQVVFWIALLVVLRILVSQNAAI